MAHVIKWLGEIAPKKAPAGECGKFGYYVHSTYVVQFLSEIDFSEFNMFTSSLYANLHAK